MQSVLLGEEIKSIAYILTIVIMGAAIFLIFCDSYLLRKIMPCLLGAFILVASIMFSGHNQVNIEKEAINSKIEYVKGIEYAEVNNTLVGIHKLENTLLSYEFIIEDKLESEGKGKVLWLYVYEKSNTTIPTQKVKLKKLVNGQLEIVEWLNGDENNRNQNRDSSKTFIPVFIPWIFK